MKVGIVVPYSWSFWGGVVEHAEMQARSLMRLGVDARILIGHDPPGSFSRLLHPRSGRHDVPPAQVIPLGRSVIVPGNGSLPNLVLSPAAVLRLRRVLDAERFDLLHVHEPLTPALGVAALAYFRGPIVATFHAAGHTRWRPIGRRLWGFLLERLDGRIAASREAEKTAQEYAPGSYELIPNGVEAPSECALGEREEHVVFVGRHEPRKGLQVLMQAWPEVRRRTGLRLRVVGADPLAVRLLLAGLDVDGDGIDVLGILESDELERELLGAKVAVVPSLGNESFGMVIVRALACATPVVASDIPGYRAVLAEAGGTLVPPGEVEPLAAAIVALVGDERRRQALGEAGRKLAVEQYSWSRLAPRLVSVYGRAAANVGRTLAGRDAQADAARIR